MTIVEAVRVMRGQRNDQLRRVRLQPPRIAERVQVADLVRRAIDDIKGFSIEKHGAPPDVDILDESSGASALCMPPFVEYALSELLKNAVQALVDTHGAWDLDEAPPVAVRVWLSRTSDAESVLPHDCGAPGLDAGSREPASAASQVAGVQVWRGGEEGSGPYGFNEQSVVEDSVQGGEPGGLWHVSVTDRGKGLSAGELQRMRSFFSTTTPATGATYGYSKQHGAQYSGLGVGVPLTVLYAECMGGSVAWTAAEGGGTAATLTLPLQGMHVQ